MVGRVGTSGVLVAAAVGTLFLVPAHGSAQDSLAASCSDLYSGSSLQNLTRCGEQGNASAQNNLGRMYGRGDGVPEDDAEAVRWYRLAAEQGNASGQNNLGVMYDNGEGVPEDDAEAARWYRLAAEQGSSIGQNNLGRMYGRGDGVPEDLVYAYMWFNLSAAQGREIAQTNKEIIEPRMTREQIAEAQRLSREWIETHPRVETASILGDRPGDEGPGLPQGAGLGDGGTAEEGRFRVVPPSPRGIILPPSNRNVRGQRIEVWVFVDERGRVVADSTQLRPPTSDRDFNARMVREAAEWVFEPAKEGGEAVASWFPYVIIM